MIVFSRNLREHLNQFRFRGSYQLNSATATELFEGRIHYVSGLFCAPVLMDKRGQSWDRRCRSRIPVWAKPAHEAHPFSHVRYRTFLNQR